MRSVALLILLTASLLLVIPPATICIAQETTGNLQGRVLDPEGNPVHFVQVTVTGPSLQGTRGANSLPDGYFYILALPVGTYSVKIFHISYQQSILENVHVRLGKTTDLGDVHLIEQVYEMEEVTITTKVPLIDPGSTVMGGNLIAEEYGELPIERNYRDMMTLLPHVHESFLGDGINFAGGTGAENKYYIDGVDGTETVMGRESTSLPYNFVKEVQVRSGGYQAEYRGSLGGVVDVITHSGSNDIRGQVFGFFLNDQLAGEARDIVTEPSPGRLCHV
ncbi:MAG: hypothetical protein GTO51_08290 [Candidatus Latescibacteria bacterium]|nr:hypothetical protein [Candidatus Latescibacterota bacterium]NIM21952.1 hypothetical protein [Candidatus Latescibacterota bacterium]NIM65970.1 hypothetical protein [Candidatus Latescibacterota bacterium]NIO02378.1 hypothetical protein [Candidatus Latescibacterota bacterium]NIO29288.1 hypothetical protein [Candidatus Latescibacterota bacterium]